MKNMNALAGIFAFALLAVGCGKTELNDPQKQVTESALSDTSDNDEQLLALSQPIAEKVPAGVIVVERTGFVQRLEGASVKFPQKCRLIAGSHLIEVVSGKQSFAFSAVVHYPKGIPFTLNTRSCSEGQRIRIEVGSGFRGLVVSKNPRSTHFPIANVSGNSDPVHPPVPCGDGVGVKCLPPTPAPVPCGDGVGVKCLPPTLYPFPCGGGAEPSCLPPAPIPCGDGAGVRCRPPVSSPTESRVSPSTTCGVSAGRRNIRIQDTGTQPLLGTVVSSGVITDMNLKEECKIGTQIVVDAEALINVLKLPVFIPVPKPLYSK